VEVAFRLLDVFTEVPFAGNQLCVVADPPTALDERTMQTLAREIAYSETTFVTAIRAGGYDVRIFTPVSELPWAGHPTLGTAFTLVSEARVPASVVQTSLAGDVPVDVDVASGTAWMRQLPPTFSDPVEDRTAIAAGAGLVVDDLVDGLPIVVGSTGIPHLLVPVLDEATLRRASRDESRCAAVCEALDAESLYLFAIRSGGDVIARMFDRSVEIGEDPATGSAVGPLGAYLALRRLAGMPGRMRVAQGELIGRPSFLDVEVTREGRALSIRVGGGVRMVGSGSFVVTEPASSGSD